MPSASTQTSKWEDLADRPTPADVTNITKIYRGKTWSRTENPPSKVNICLSNACVATRGNVVKCDTYKVLLEKRRLQWTRQRTELICEKEQGLMVRSRLGLISLSGSKKACRDLKDHRQKTFDSEDVNEKCDSRNNYQHQVPIFKYHQHAADGVACRGLKPFSFDQCNFSPKLNRFQPNLEAILFTRSLSRYPRN